MSITRADARDPASVLAASTVTEVLDFSQLVAIPAVALMHFVPGEDDPLGMLRRYRNALVPGSYLAMTHGSADYERPTAIADVHGLVALYRDSATPAYNRSRPEIEALFDELSLVEPGLIDINHWRNEAPGPPQLSNYAGLARIV